MGDARSYGSSVASFSRNGSRLSHGYRAARTRDSSLHELAAIIAFGAQRVVCAAEQHEVVCGVLACARKRHPVMIRAPDAACGAALHTTRVRDCVRAC